jgi:hypothetical protein
MNGRRHLRIASAIIALVVIAAACGSEEPEAVDSGIEGSIRFAFSPDPAWDWIVDEGILEEMEQESGFRIIRSETWDELAVFAGGHADIVSIGSYETPVVEAETGVDTVTIGKFNMAKDVVVVSTEDDWETFADLPEGCVIGVESFVGGSTVWQALAADLDSREIAEASDDLPMGTSDYQVMPDLIIQGDFCAGIVDPTQAIPEFASGAMGTLFDGKSASQLYAEVYQPGHEGMMSNNFVALQGWYDDNPEEVAFFMEVWQRALTEWSENREEIIDAYPEHFAADSPEQTQFIKDYFNDTFDWFVDSPYLDEEWIEGEAEITEILRRANLIPDDLDMPTHVCIDPESGEETCRIP